MDDLNLFKSILDKLHEGVYLVDGDRRITYWNSGAERITGFSAEIVVGRKCADNILNHINEKGEILCKEGCPLQATLMDGKPRQVEVYLHHAQGHRLPVVVYAEPIMNVEGKIIGAVETFTDNSLLFSYKNKARELQKAIDRDELTGLSSRKDIMAKLEFSLIEMKSIHTRFGLLYLDLDHFKLINDRFGYTVGDKVLKMSANSIRHSLRNGDEVGRLGGEEFLVILRDVNEKALSSVAEKIRMMILNSLIMESEQLIQITVSIGATLLKLDDSPESAIQRADELMYRSKKNGRNRVTVELF